MLMAHGSQKLSILFYFCSKEIFFILNTDDLGDTMLSVNVHRVSSLKSNLFIFIIFKCPLNFQVSLSLSLLWSFYLFISGSSCNIKFSDFPIFQLPYKLSF
ncbi:hypothetical protein EUTSA_v10022929mg [Eutrema salsugineum]|uniref:Uncharacterized protein n=1 Tax=Eutrema salsugineum TaxID=72664 RepID=V4LJW6_EUTSA|nr:hypothetical protein EUTSA_v10022929mg [Eutrema salsugineum]